MMRNFAKINRWALPLFAAVVLLVSGCSNVFAPPSFNNEAGKGVLNISISSDVGGRALVPVNVEFSKYVLSFESKSGHTSTPANLEVDPTDGVAQIELAEGTWEITATGHVFIGNIEYEAASGKGTITIDFSQNASPSLPITISATIEGEEGFFSYELEYPIAKVDTVSVKFGKFPGTTFEEFSNDEKNNLEYEAGYYLLTVNLENENQAAGWASIVHIYSGLLTKAHIVFTADDFSDFITLSGTATITGGASGATVTVEARTSDVDNTPLSLLGTTTVGTANAWSIKTASLPSNATTVYFWVYENGVPVHIEAVAAADLTSAIVINFVRKYNIIIAPSANGTVEIDVESPAAATTNVTITAEPTDDDFILGTLTVEDAEGNDIPVTAGTFAMPNSDVTISAAFIIDQPHFIIDFEDSVWAGGSYNSRTVLWGGYSWTVSGVGNMATGDRFEGARSLRLRSSSTATTPDTVENSIELAFPYYLTSIKEIWFDYASFGSHEGGEIVLYTQAPGEDWKEVDSVTAPAWDGAMTRAKFKDLDIEDGVRFKIEKTIVDGNTSVNIDNIVVIGMGADFADRYEIDSIDPVASDFTFSGLSTAIENGIAKTVTVTSNIGHDATDITVYYNGSETAPSAAGSYVVTFDVAAVPGYNEATDLVAGTLVIEVQPANSILVDFEDAAWATSATAYNTNTVTLGGQTWTTLGIVNTADANDRRIDSQSIRLRGNTGDGTHRVELTSYVTDIQSISFDYASYSTHQNGTIVLSYRESGDADWTVAEKWTAIPSWTNGGSIFQRAHFDFTTLSVSNPVRFKIERAENLANNTSVNIDNIVVIGASAASFYATPTAADFDISGLTADEDNVNVSITHSASSNNTGAITIKYDGSTTVPTTAGTYAVTFDVAEDAVNGFRAVSGLAAGTLIVYAAGAAPNASFTVDFEDSTTWNMAYGGRNITENGYNWLVYGTNGSSSDASDRYIDARSLRLRGNASDTGNIANRIELLHYVNGIASIEFEYASYGTHSGGQIALYTQVPNGSWLQVGTTITVPSWSDAGNAFTKATFDNINITGGVRFKIEKDPQAGSTSLNIDNIVVTGTDSTTSLDRVGLAVIPVATDFNITGVTTITEGDPVNVSITHSEIPASAITIYYNGSTTVPSAVGSYPVTFSVAAATVGTTYYQAVSGLSAGTLTIQEVIARVESFLINFEDSIWANIAYETGSVAARNATTPDNLNWLVSGYSTMDNNDRRTDADGNTGNSIGRSIRLRGNATDSTNGVTNRIELLSLIPNGIKSITFDYGSYSTHTGGTLTLYTTTTTDDSAWKPFGEPMTMPTWVDYPMPSKTFEVNIEGSVRFKLEKTTVSGSTSFNIDNLEVKTYDED